MENDRRSEPDRDGIPIAVDGVRDIGLLNSIAMAGADDDQKKNLSTIQHYAIRRGFGSALVFKTANHFLSYYNGWCFELRLNGEERMLRALAQHLAEPTIFDVGANVGEWTGLALHHLPRATVHAFEISPPTAARLHASYQGDSRIKVNTG